MEAFRDNQSASWLHSGKRVRGFWYGYHKDAHSSLVGVREVTNGAHRCFQTDQEVNDWINRRESWRTSIRRPKKGQLGLFAYPGQSNMTGRRLPLDWYVRSQISLKVSLTKFQACKDPYIFPWLRNVQSSRRCSPCHNYSNRS